MGTQRRQVCGAEEAAGEGLHISHNNNNFRYYDGQRAENSVGKKAFRKKSFLDFITLTRKPFTRVS